MEDVKQLYSGPELGDTAVEGIGSFAANVNSSSSSFIIILAPFLFLPSDKEELDYIRLA